MPSFSALRLAGRLSPTDSTAPVVWIGDNVGQLAERVPDFGNRFGFHPVDFDQGSFPSVSYGGVRLARRTPAGGPGIMRYDAVDATVTRVMASTGRPLADAARRIASGSGPSYTQKVLVLSSLT